jgi:hypothetical protein
MYRLVDEAVRTANLLKIYYTVDKSKQSSSLNAVETGERLHSEFQKLETYYHQNKLFFSAKLAKSLEGIVAIIGLFAMRFKDVLELKKPEWTEDNTAKKFVDWWETLDGKMAELKRELEKEFRALLGVD